MLTGLEFLGKVFALHDESDTFRRATYAPLFQTDGLYQRELEAVPKAFAALENGDPEVARAVLRGVASKEATQRAQANFAPTFQAHHENSMGGLAQLTPDLSMPEHLIVRDVVNDKGINTGTQASKLLSGSSTFFHPAAHTNPETLTTGGYTAGQKVLSQFRNPDPVQRASDALKALEWERDTSRAAHQLSGEQEIRYLISKLAGVPIEEMMSTDLDTTLRKGSTRSKAASSNINLKPQAPLIKGIIDQISKRQSNELYIPKMYKTEHSVRPGVWSNWKVATSTQERDYMGDYLRSERPGLQEALEIIKAYRRR